MRNANIHFEQDSFTLHGIQNCHYSKFEPTRMMLLLLSNNEIVIIEETAWNFQWSRKHCKMANSENSNSKPRHVLR